MDLEKVIADLKAERVRIDENIIGLGRNAPVPEDHIAHLKSQREQLEQVIVSLETRLVQRNAPDPPLPPGAAMRIPQPLDHLTWAVSGRKRQAS